MQEISRDNNLEELQEGMEKGIEQGKMQMIRGMYEISVPLETIAKASKLSVKEIERILNLK
ncbi:hypothetical protein bcere0024_021260 [Bacillus cereus Rock4-18]|nr:hypothetical protein bcere0024_021260 [Bacillus cereus Rock4-18]